MFKVVKGGKLCYRENGGVEKDRCQIRSGGKGGSR